MVDLPRHSDTDEDAGRESVTGPSRKRRIAIGIVLGVVAIVVIALHLSGAIGGESL